MASAATPASTLDYPRIKLLTLGNAGVGKSCFVKRFCEDRFVSKYIPTIGIDYGVKRTEVNPGLLAKYAVLEGTAVRKKDQPAGVRINFWDVAGGNESVEIRNEFYGPAQGIILMFDVRDEDSFHALDAWWEEAGRYVPLVEGEKPSIGVAGSTTAATPAGRAVGDNGNTPPVVIVCGNKVDRDGPGGGSRMVSAELGQKWATAHHCAGYYETSAVTDGAVLEPMNALIHQVIARFLL
eukprot:gene11991-8262_t